ncbi:MAG: formyltetrahydrofolate deformylase [Candidatus Aldehydirespiratoraceae bacterium]|jgi:formyltetrahydrofolate deformylase
MPTHVLTLSCPDRKGIVAAIATALVGLDANILQNAEFSDPATSTFCVRTRFETPIEDADEIAERLAPTATGLGGDLRIRAEDRQRRALVMVSKFDHCLLDLLYRVRTGELPIDIPLVVSNHRDLREVVEREGIEFVHIPVSKETKPTAEAELAALVEQHSIDVVVLARYMQVLSDEFCGRYPAGIINIHHSFLPGFKGARPYHQAWERGVKLTGATAHFVTADLDEGPIICQDVEAVSHRHTPEQMVARGRDVERRVLSSAVTAFAEDRIFLLANGRTVVFD